MSTQKNKNVKTDKSIEEQLLNSFLKALKVKNRNYRIIIKEDEDFCEFLYENFKTAKKIATNENIFSFYLVEELNDFLYNKISENNEFYIDDYSNNLSSNYYGVLKDYMYEAHNKANIDKIVWIKSVLRYIDNMCQTLSFARDKAYRDTTDTILNSNNQIDDFSKQIVALRKDVENVTYRYDDIQRMYLILNEELDNTNNNAKKDIEESKRKATETTIAVLGVFSAIVLAFNGSTLFASSALEAIDSVSIYRLLIIVVSLGVVFVNVIFALFNFIGDLIERNSLIKNDKDKKKAVYSISFKHLIIFNLTAIIIIASIIFCWHTGQIEKRNIKVEKEKESYSVMLEQNATTTTNEIS